MRAILLFLSLFPIVSFADASYTVTFINPNNYYNITVKTPTGDKSEDNCMHVWKVPATDTIVTPGAPLRVLIEDKDDYGCWDKPKSNTWHIHAEPLPQYKNSLVAKDGTIEFYHAKVSGWETSMNTNDISGQKTLFVTVTCGTSSDNNCLNRYVTGLGGGGGYRPEDNINVTFFGTNYWTGCRDKKKDVSLLSNKIIGVYPTWGGAGLNHIKTLYSPDFPDVPVDFVYDEKFDTDSGMRFFKYSLQALATNSKLVATCNGQGSLGQIYLSR